MLCVRHAPSRGQCSFFLQLQVLAEVLLALFRIFAVVVFYHARHVGHAAIADFGVISVK